MMKVILNILLTMEPTENHLSLLILYDGSSLYSMVRLYCGPEWHGEQSQSSHDNMRDESTYLRKRGKGNKLQLIFQAKQKNIAR